MSEAASRANGRRSNTRAFVEHVFAQQKSHMGLFVRTIGIARPGTKIGMAKRKSSSAIGEVRLRLISRRDAPAAQIPELTHATAWS